MKTQRRLHIAIWSARFHAVHIHGLLFVTVITFETFDTTNCGNCKATLCFRVKNWETLLRDWVCWPPPTKLYISWIVSAANFHSILLKIVRTFSQLSSLTSQVFAIFSGLPSSQYFVEKNRSREGDFLTQLAVAALHRALVAYSAGDEFSVDFPLTTEWISRWTEKIQRKKKKTTSGLAVRESEGKKEEETTETSSYGSGEG